VLLEKKERRIKMRNIWNTGTALLLSVFLVMLALPTSASAESTWERIKRTNVLRVAGLVGVEPNFHKDLKTGEWSGFCISFARDIAEVLGAKLEIVESTWGNSILDLQANKIDISFALTPTPKRALVIDFTRPLYYNTFAIVTRKGFTASTWEMLNKPSVKISADIGSSHEQIIHMYAPNAQYVGFKSTDEVIMAVQSKRADVLVSTVFLGLTSLKKNPELGAFIIPTPILSHPVSAGVRQEEDPRFRNFVSSWADYNRAMGTTRNWILEALKMVNIEPKDVPANVQF
jgi:polar amino acid transport system substrate-binding protein